jgi:hypothetical protein
MRVAGLMALLAAPRLILTAAQQHRRGFGPHPCSMKCHLMPSGVVGFRWNSHLAVSGQ